jgi:ATP-dependent DNA ligase
LFEKYDGIRGFWNPKQKQFFSRHGKVIRMPEEVIAQMPDIMLDGEIW